MSDVAHDPTVLPPNLPPPIDDGAADHLAGMRVPPIELPSTAGATDRVDLVPEGFERRIVYAYPRMGRPGEAPLVPEWDSIPGARGCTPESCGFRDHARDLRDRGAAVAGLSMQSTEQQAEAVTRLHLPFPLLSDRDLELARALNLPTFVVAGQKLFKRFTLVIKDATIERLFYPIFPPNAHAVEVLRWIDDHPAE